MPPPGREDVYTITDKLDERVARLERTVRDLTTAMETLLADPTIAGLINSGQLVLPNSATPPTPAGGAVFVQAGALRFRGNAGTNTKVANA